jgi:hypothetical protein
MKVTVEDRYTEIHLNNTEVEILCKPGQGSNTCILLVCGPKGFGCCSKHQSIIMSLIDRCKQGLTNAKRIGCKFVDDISPFDLGMGEHIINLPEGYNEDK